MRIETSFTDGKYTFEEKRNINGNEVLCTKLEGKFQSIPFTFFNYYYVGDIGTIQIITWTYSELFDEYKNDLTDFLNGFEVSQDRKPQPPKVPPQALAFTADMAQADLVKAGEAIFYGKGTCALCHPIGEKGERAPNLAGIGARTETRIKEAVYKGNATNGAEYLVESLLNPAVYVVEGYQPSMPPLGRQLNDLEMAALVAFQQSLGGDVTVNRHTRFPKYRGEGTDGILAVASVSGKSGAELVKAWQCNNCHTFDSPVRILGPSLWDIGARANAAYIRESILQPDAKVVPGYPRGVEKATLNALGFYQTVTLQELDTLVDYLVSLKGEK